MGVVLRSSDIKAYVAMWRYAGHVLGIDHDILPETLEMQEDFMLASMLHQGASGNFRQIPFPPAPSPLPTLASQVSAPRARRKLSLYANLNCMLYGASISLLFPPFLTDSTSS